VIPYDQIKSANEDVRTAIQYDQIKSANEDVRTDH